MRKLSHVPIVFAGMKGVTLKSNPLGLFNVIKPWHFQIITKEKKEFILEINPVRVSNIVKPLHITVVPKYIKHHLLERKPVSITNVVHTFCLTDLFKGIKERNMNVISVVKLLHVKVVSKYIKEYIQERKLMSVIRVLKFVDVKED